MMTALDMTPTAGRVPRTDPICPQGRLAEDLLLEIFEHIIPGALFTEDECRKMYTALAGTSSFFASIVTPRRFRHVTSIPSGRRPDRAPVWISLVGTGDHAALAVAQQVMSMEVEEMDTDPRLALFVAWLSMPRLSTLVLRQWVISRETLDALSHLDNLESLSLLRCTLERSAIPHIRPLRIQKLFLETYSRAEPLAHEERGLASLADAAVLRVLRAPASSLPTRFFPGCVFPVLETACIDLFDHSSADLQQAVCAFLTKTIALEKLQLSGFFGNASEFRLPLSALAHLTHLKAPAHVLSPLAVGRSIRMLDLTTSESASVPLTEGLASLRLPEIREVLARVEHLKIFDNLLLGGNVLPCAACLETLRVEVEHHNYQIHRVIRELVSGLTRASATLRTFSIDLPRSYFNLGLFLSVQHGYVFQCSQSAPSLSDISIGSVFRWVPERVGETSDEMEPDARVWRPRVVDKGALTKVITNPIAGQQVTDFNDFLHHLYADEIAMGAVDPQRAGFV